MSKTIDNYGIETKISDYMPIHYFENQKYWVAPGIPINPTLRTDFDSTPNDERDDLEVEHWWLKPYIVTVHFRMVDKDYDAYVARLNSYKTDKYTSVIAIPAEWEVSLENDKQIWFSAWPSGTKYELRCLNGGSWDRSTVVGGYTTLSEAIEGAQTVDMEDFGAVMENIRKTQFVPNF
jgi:hypothetical protein